jgi:uncharacterized membrane protein
MDAYTQIALIVAVGIVFGLCGFAAVTAVIAIFDHLTQQESE